MEAEVAHLRDVRSAGSGERCRPVKTSGLCHLLLSIAAKASGVVAAYVRAILALGREEAARLRVMGVGKWAV